MMFRRSAPAILVATIIMSLSATLAVGHRISGHLEEGYDADEFRLIGEITAAQLTKTELQALSAAEFIVALPAVRASFAAHQQDKLLAAVADPFNVLKQKYGVTQGLFHTAPATTFLRLHKPEYSGDDQSGWRLMVVDAIRSASPRKGIDIGTTGVGIFGTAPVISSDGKVIGSFSVGQGFDSLLDEIKMNFGLEAAAYFNEDKLRETATDINPEMLAEHNRVGSFIKIYATHPTLMGSLVTDDDIEVTEAEHYLRTVNGKTYGVLLEPLYGPAKTQIGVLATVKEFTEDRAAFKKAFINQLWVDLAGGVFIIAMMLLVLKGMVLRPLAVLGQHLKALAGDEAGAVDKLDPDDRWCEEISDAIRYADQVHRRASPPSQRGEG